MTQKKTHTHIFSKKHIYFFIDLKKQNDLPIHQSVYNKIVLNENTQI